MRIAQRQKRQNPFAVERLTCHRFVRFFGANSGNQRVMVIIPVGERDIGFIAQP
ncbi:Uncharacterised protein [Klebsiella pneumoniae]|nr:Uncharacterised protein [Klebsiella pneumoniae]